MFYTIWPVWFVAGLQIILQERESRRQKFLQDMMLGNFTSGITRYLPPAWLVESTSKPVDGENVDVLDRGSAAEKKALLLSKIHSRRFRE